MADSKRERESFSVPLPQKKKPDEVDRFLARQLERGAEADLNEAMASLLGGATGIAHATAARCVEDWGAVRDHAIEARKQLLLAIEHLDAVASHLEEARKAREGTTLEGVMMGGAAIDE